MPIVRHILQLLWIQKSTTYCVFALEVGANFSSRFSRLIKIIIWEGFTTKCLKRHSRKKEKIADYLEVRILVLIVDFTRTIIYHKEGYCNPRGKNVFIVFSLFKNQSQSRALRAWVYAFIWEGSFSPLFRAVSLTYRST